jgi:predicted secreted Zn-dependent protease
MDASGGKLDGGKRQLPRGGERRAEVAEPGAAGLVWHRASSCDESSCVEVAATDLCVFVRNSSDPAGRILCFLARDWEVFLAGIRNNEFIPSIRRYGPASGEALPGARL